MQKLVSSLLAFHPDLPNRQIDVLANIQFCLGDLKLPKLLHGSSHHYKSCVACEEHLGFARSAITGAVGDLFGVQRAVDST